MDGPTPRGDGRYDAFIPPPRQPVDKLFPRPGKLPRAAPFFCRSCILGFCCLQFAEFFAEEQMVVFNWDFLENLKYFLILLQQNFFHGNFHGMCVFVYFEVQNWLAAYPCAYSEVALKAVWEIFSMTPKWEPNSKFQGVEGMKVELRAELV